MILLQLAVRPSIINYSELGLFTKETTSNRDLVFVSNLADTEFLTTNEFKGALLLNNYYSRNLYKLSWALKDGMYMYQQMIGNIQHSDNPNCAIRYRTGAPVDKNGKIVIITSRRILKGEELSIDYRIHFSNRFWHERIIDINSNAIIKESLSPYEIEENNSQLIRDNLELLS